MEPVKEYPPDDKIAKWLLYTQIIGATFLQKIPITFGNGTQILVGMFIMMGLTLLGLLTRRLEVRSRAFALFLVMSGGLVLTQLIGGEEFSMASLALLLVIHVPYIFGLRDGLVRPGRELAFFRRVMIFITVCGIAEFLLQYVIGWQYAFYLDAQLPDKWIMQHYNQLNTIKAGSGQYKSNGFFMLEPAMFCQFLALSIIIESIYFKKPKVIALYVAGILTTFSGTGLIILGMVAPFYMLNKRKYKTLVAVTLALTLFIVVAPFIGFGVYTGRVSEFTDTGTSGYSRFVAIYPAIRDYILPHTNTLFLGTGAGGSMTVVGAHMPYRLHPPSWGKVWLEYGLIGLFCYMPFMLTILFYQKRSGYLKAAMAIEFFFDGYILIPTVHGLIIALLAWPSKREPELEGIDNTENATAPPPPVYSNLPSSVR